ncbi:hypothetical protein GCM10022233_65420 [Streptomyces shaanxiensis]|uniref:DUF4760 domain-containing protein n=2 Tax=Streptomyces shaanxiensis TaxID=653357 RepID=A0ABP7VYQ1_9ACTN
MDSRGIAPMERGVPGHHELGCRRHIQSSRGAGMDNGLTALIAALVGVTGTLLAPIFSQRIVFRFQERQFERQQRAVQAQWTRDREETRLSERRACYIATNTAYRRYRIQLMNYLWDVHQGTVTPTCRDELEAARHAHHAAFAEAQLVASSVVLAELDAIAKELAQAYRRVKRLEEGNPVRSFEEIEQDLQDLWERWKQMRGLMRTCLGVEGPSSRPPANQA